MKAVLVVGSIVLLTVAPVVSQPVDDNLIVPGKRISKWTLEMTVEDLLAGNGQPTQVYPDDLKRGYAAWYWKSNGLLMVTSGFGSFWRRSRYGQKIEALEIDLPDYKTEKGVSTRSWCGIVNRVYGGGSEGSRPAPNEGRVIYQDIGIEFRFSAGPRGTPTSIIVPRHPPLGGLQAIGIFRPAAGIWRAGYAFSCGSPGDRTFEEAVEGDMQAWLEVKAAYERLTKLKSYRVIHADGASVIEVINPDRFRQLHFPEKREGIFVRDRYAGRIGQGKWLCISQQALTYFAPFRTLPPMWNATMRNEPRILIVKISRIGETTIGKDRVKGFQYTAELSGAFHYIEGYSLAPGLRLSERLFVRVKDELPRRTEVLDDQGNVYKDFGVADYSDFNAPIRNISLPTQCQ